MDKTALRNFAIYARRRLIQEIKNKAARLGITEEGIEKPLSQNSDMYTFDIGDIEPYKIYGDDIVKYNRLVRELETRTKHSDYKTAYQGIIEEVAYTWFNRIIAIRFMEVNNYLPDRLRILSSGREGVREPEIVTYYYDTSLSFTDKELKALESWRADGSNIAMDKMFQLLFIKQCNALNDNLPELFEKTNDYAELLLTISYNDPDGVVYRLVHDIDEEYFNIESRDGNGQVEIIGWLYQYYNSERKDEVINILSKKTVKKQDIPAATQLFTTDWVVRYMVDNSLGKYWLERNPNSIIKDSLKYLMPGEIPVVDEKISPEDIKVFDNAMGSGHCLCYAFDVLLMIYESEGYTAREAARLIVEKNLYGLDIDKRAYQLAYFAIMMKARQHDRKALDGTLSNNLSYFEDSTMINRGHLDYLGVNMDKIDREQALKDLKYLIKEFENATEIGSILRLDPIHKDLVYQFINDDHEKGQAVQVRMEEIDIEKTQKQLRNLIKIAGMLMDKYHIMVTNPPYLNKFDKNLKKYVGKNYNDYRGDLFSVFIYNNLEMCKKGGYSAYMSPFVWMFIKSYEKLREYIIKTRHISTLIQMEYSAFEEATVPICTFVLQNNKSEEKGQYIKLSDFTGGMEIQRIKTLEAIENPRCGYYYESNQENFGKIPGMPIAYWASNNVIEAFEKGLPLNSLIDPRQGLATADNNRFLRLWHEVDINKICFNANSISSSIESKAKWFPYNKGGARRQWYGNYDYVVNWENDGFEIRNFKDDRGRQRSVVRNPGYYFKEAITWSLITSGGFSIRYREPGSIHDVAGMSAFANDHDNLMYILGIMSTKISNYIFKMLNPTINLQIGDFNNFPILLSDNQRVLEIVKENILIAQMDWNSFETSWDFVTHPLLDKSKQGEVPSTIEAAYENWKTFANSNFEKLKANEEVLNRIFIEIYGLEDELTPEVSDRDITITKIFDNKDEIYEDIKGNSYILTKEDVIRSFISYGIGCIFGRYSLDVEGLAYAGGEWDDGKYKSFKPVDDNVILITDEDYYIEDITSKFVEFVEAAFGAEYLQENLEFIAQALGGKGDPREVIRNYFLKDFYKDHVRTYKKRPIYWLYDSGRQNGFKALIYMHRYNEDTTGKVRVDYLHEMQKIYERNIENLKEEMIHNNNPREVTKMERLIQKLIKQLDECRKYDERIAHLALRRISIDLDDGIKVNYDKIQLDENNKNLKILARI